MVCADRKNAARDEIVEDIEKEEKERRERAETLRRQRSQEAQQLISKRTIDARAVFERNTSAGQLNSRRASYQPNGVHGTEKPKRLASDADVAANAALLPGRKASLPTWLPTATTTAGAPDQHSQTETSGNTNNSFSVNGSEQVNVYRNQVEGTPIEEEQDWESTFFQSKKNFH